MLTRSFAILAGCVLASTASAQTVQLITFSDKLPNATSGDGSVVVGDDSATGEYFEWTAAGGAVAIGGATAGNGVGGNATISEDGSYVGGTAFNSMSGLYELSRYDRGTGTWTNLGGIGGSSGQETSSGWDISGDGNHVVGLGWVNAGEAHATQWSDGTGTFDLGSTIPGNSSRANATDFDGDVVVGWQDGVSRNGAVWINGVQTIIQTPSGGLVGEAGAVSADGQWAVGIGGSTTSNEAWRWSQATGAVGLGSLGLSGFPAPRGYATAIDADGSTIVGFDRGFGPATTGEGWIWTEATGLISLDDYVAGLGLSVPNNLRLSLPLGISADGKTIVGWGRSDTAFVLGWIIQIDDGGCTGSNYCIAVDNSTGQPGSISNSGSLSITLNDLVLTASDVPSNLSGLFFYGTGQSQVPFGFGFKCVANPVYRLPVIQSSAAGTASYAVDYGNLPPGGDITAGSTWNFQYWYRDPASGAPAFNLTDGLNATFCP